VLLSILVHRFANQRVQLGSLFEKLIRDEMAQWGPVVRKANIQM